MTKTYKLGYPVLTELTDLHLTLLKRKWGSKREQRDLIAKDLGITTMEFKGLEVGIIRYLLKYYEEREGKE